MLLIPDERQQPLIAPDAATVLLSVSPGAINTGGIKALRLGEGHAGQRDLMLPAVAEVVETFHDIAQFLEKSCQGCLPARQHLGEQ